MLNQNQETPLCLASHRGQQDTVDLLLDSGSDITHRDREGSTPLHRAARSGHFATVKLLLRRGADVDIRDSGGKTPLDLARSDGSPKVAKLLEAHTKDIYRTADSTPTPSNKVSRDITLRRSVAVTWRRRQYRY
jgi:ankyrin repeat protein